MKIGLISLGCPKNLVDSEVMLGLARDAGHELTQDASSADVLVVNTCAFIDSAKQESVDTILEMARFKSEGSCQRLIVTGCMAERYRDQLQKEIPEIDAVLGTGEVPRDRQGHRWQCGRRRGGAAHVPSAGAEGGREPVGSVGGRCRPASPPQRTVVHLRRGYAATPGDAEALRVHQGRRRLRLHVCLLHHSDAAWGVSQPSG